ncbi:hypothetical protein KIPB_001606 [Kipferlia bialata]|uniref:Uncharacterized protein n=1 Tax=Kipferlia bialata TaxID=797122 RepID=A0A391P0C9_9EUKA|nr:hypothetical protein KIPB_001606 [Kipferlia bialata]|eukprot:g1606.t1
MARVAQHLVHLPITYDQHRRKPVFDTVSGEWSRDLEGIFQGGSGVYTTTTGDNPSLTTFAATHVDTPFLHVVKVDTAYA